MSESAAPGARWVATVWFALSVALPVILWARWNSNRLLVLLSIAAIVYAAANLAVIILRGNPRLAAGTLWLFMYVTVGVVPLAQTYTGLYPNLRDYSTLVHSQAVALAAMVAFQIGGLIQRTVNGERKPRYPEWAGRRTLSIPALRALSVLAVLTSAYYVYRVGGPSTLFMSRRDLGDSLEAVGNNDGSQVGSALLISFGQVPIIIVFTAWLVYYSRNPEKRNVTTRLWLVLLLAVNIVVNNPISNARYWFLTVIIGLVYAMPRLGPNVYRMSLIGGAIAALIAFPYSDYFRERAVTRDPMTVGPVAQTLSTKDYDQSVMAANGIWYVDVFGHTWGDQTLGSVLFWIPRSLWPDKAIDTGVLIGQHLQASTTNLSSPLWIEFWVDFGIVGTILGFVFLGLIAQRLDDLFIATRRRAGNTVLILQLLLPFLAGYMFILLRGPLLQSMSRLAVILGVCFLLRGRRAESFDEDLPEAGNIIRTRS